MEQFIFFQKNVPCICLWMPFFPFLFYFETVSIPRLVSNRLQFCVSDFPLLELPGMTHLT